MKQSAGGEVETGKWRRRDRVVDRHKWSWRWRARYR